MQINIVAQLTFIFPELLITLGAIVLLLVGAFSSQRSYPLVTYLAVIFLIIAVILELFVQDDGTFFHNALILDPFSRFLKILVLIGAMGALLLSCSVAKSQNLDKFEFSILVMFSSVGMMLMVSAGNMLTLYLGLELQSLALYVLASFNRDNLRSSEAGLKYFVLGALSSGMLLYGISLVYGSTGQIGFVEISNYLAGQQPQFIVLVGIVLILTGLAFKISAVPFHMWTPDVYQGAPTPITAYFAGAPKIAAMALIVRLIIKAFAPLTTVAGAMPAWQQIIIFMSLASMILAAFAAIGQTNIKRLMAYSSISHMGYALVGLAAGTISGVTGVIIYMTVYLAMTLGCFAFILGMRSKNGNLENINDLAGIGRTNPYMAVVMVILLFSLAGIPPMAGFFGKWYTFLAAVEAGLIPLAVVGMVTSVIGAFYYLRLIKIMYFDEPKEGFLLLRSDLKIILGLSGCFTLFYIFFGSAIYHYAGVAASSLF